MPDRGGSNPESGPQPIGAGQGIALRTRFFRLDWTLRFTHTTITIDGHSHERPWGEHHFLLEPGHHQLQVSYPYLRLSRVGKASIQLDVAPNQVVHASYRHRDPCLSRSCRASSPSRRPSSPEHETR